MGISKSTVLTQNSWSMNLHHTCSSCNLLSHSIWQLHPSGCSSKTPWNHPWLLFPLSNCISNPLANSFSTFYHPHPSSQYPASTISQLDCCGSLLTGLSSGPLALLESILHKRARIIFLNKVDIATALQTPQWLPSSLKTKWPWVPSPQYHCDLLSRHLPSVTRPQLHWSPCYSSYMPSILHAPGFWVCCSVNLERSFPQQRL